MHLLEIILDGFKSYATRTVISGFDPEFNAITGLNGSGKSNVLDSICFVLGISNLSQVRASNLNELIYKQGQAGVTKASVTLVFDNSSAAMSPHGYEQYNQITVTRQVVIGGRNKYMINGHNAQLQRVQNLFHSVQLNVNNPHFLIMQGRITKVLNMKPIETLGMIEEAAGTRMFEMKKQQAIKTIEKKETKLTEIKRVIDEDIAPRLSKLGSERAAYLEYTSLSNEVESLDRFCQAYEFVCAKETQRKCVEGGAADVARKAELEAMMSASEGEQAALKKQITALLAKKEKESAGELKQLEAAEQELSKALTKLTAEHGQLRKALDADAAANAANEKAIAELRKTQANSGTDQAKAAAAVEKAAAAHKAKSEAVGEKQAAYEAAMGLGAGKNGEGAKNLQGQLSEASAEVSANETKLKEGEMTSKHVAKQVKEVEKKLAEARKSGGKQEKEHTALRAAVAELRAQMDATGFDEAAEVELTKGAAKAQAAVAALVREEERLAAGVAGVDFKYTDPEKGFNRSRVKGTVASNLAVRDAANTTALEALAGGRLHQVIVDDEATGMQLLTKGGLTRRVTLIPLSKIQPRIMKPEHVASAKKLVGEAKAHLAVDLLEYKAAVGPAMAHIFGNTLVCADKAAARAVCEKLGLKTVTLEGDLYDPSGTLTGGSRAKAGASILARIGAVTEVRGRLAAAEAELNALSSKLDLARTSSEKFGGMKESLELKQHQLELHTQALGASATGQLASTLEALQAEMAAAEGAAKEAKGALKGAADRVKELTAQVRDFEGNREAGMAKAKAAIAAAEKEAKASAKAVASAEAAEQKLGVALAELDKELASAQEAAAELAARQEQQEGSAASKAEAEAAKRGEYEGAAEALSACQAGLATYESEAGALVGKREEMEAARADGQVELKQIEHRCARADKDLAGAEACCVELLRRHPWMEAEQVHFGVAGTDYDFAKRKPATVQAAVAKKAASLEAISKRINKKVLSMFETAEAEYADLMAKKDIVEKDKFKIEAVISELAQKKIEALQKTWTKVNKDFGSIFSTLLPGARAKLEPQEGLPVEEGLIVKVGFGEVWKQSLLELSGGQRSLIALSLVLSLLRFKPAPVYILDEIDAALDLSHTQNIGTMIKTHFKQSQFLVVSLKEGMFNNANVLFRTKFVDGISTIARTVPAGRLAQLAQEEAAAKAGKGKAAAGGAARAALGVKN